MRSFGWVVLAVCVGLLINGQPAYADATPDPVRACRAEDVGKPCPKGIFYPPELCVETTCDTGLDPRLIGPRRTKCFRCKYDEVADRPNRERRERERAVEREEGEREERLRIEWKQRKQRNLRLAAAALVLLVAGYFISRRFRSKKS